MKQVYSIEVCEPDEMANGQAGNYFPDEDGVIHIQVCRQKNEQYQFLITLHELYEEIATRLNGIHERDITEFDKLSDAEGWEGEPAENPKSIYYKEHFQADSLERLVAAFLGIDWRTYEKEIIYKTHNDK